MSQTFASGQRVRINDATPETPDLKGVVYYDFFRGLTGEVIKSYPDGNVAISIDRKTLPEHIKTRHEQTEQKERDRWLNGLSEEDRNKLSEKDKKFHLRYTLLVSGKHVVADQGKDKPAQVSTPKKSAAVTAHTKAEDTSAPARATSDDLTAKEREYLESFKHSEK